MKKPRSDDEDCTNYGSLHIEAFECLVKCVNSKAIGLGSLKRNFQTLCKSSKGSLNPGGSNQVIRNLPMGDELPIRPGSGLLVGDNAQRGISKLQKHTRLKWKRPEASVSVQTHLVTYENEDDPYCTIFKDENMGPATTDFHPLFRPVSGDFLEIFKIRLKIDEELGYRGISLILNTFLQDVINDIKIGGGVTSLSILRRLSETNSGNVKKVCERCHFTQDYDINTHNVCRNCMNNPTMYTKAENNPYLRFGLQHGDFKPVKSYEQESLNLNPSSYQSLSELMDHLDKTQAAKADKMSVIGLDGLPGIRIKRMQADMVKCLTHEIMFKLSDVEKCKEHNAEDCEIGWIFEDKVVLLGESHEEIFLNLRCCTAASHFGLLSVLEELGKKSKLNQQAAIKKKELNKLYPTNLLFIEGALKMLMSSYLESIWSIEFTPSLQDFVKFCLENTNPQVTCLFLTVYYFMMPALLKRLGLRLHRPDIADAGSALGRHYNILIIS